MLFQLSLIFVLNALLNACLSVKAEKEYHLDIYVSSSISLCLPTSNSPKFLKTSHFSEVLMRSTQESR